jgi:hypothetical protein
MDTLSWRRKTSSAHLSGRNIIIKRYKKKGNNKHKFIATAVEACLGATLISSIIAIIKTQRQKKKAE